MAGAYKGPYVLLSLANIARARDAGMNNRQIAALAGVSRWAVIKVLKRAQRDGSPDTERKS